MWHSGNWGDGFCNGASFFGFGHGLFGWIFPLLFWGLIIYGVISIIRRLISGNQFSKSESALDILKKRYAAGEINEQEFSEMRVALTSK
ncbi:MAG: SHOCT domain-containing protein [Proteobacteria bacterium]|nr:SHOCT domain-containing protein [Pseudomonadota bacterium]MBU1585184.1 SHOCT domain-containing protein [Pseudomonadota bacterium]MBU2454497.1 SHOCT domain-containing protein [Pseudomonadota bacterium]MBU2629074.1 SHOCT domain-containing protein [Pseudomonadota bacterium]